MATWREILSPSKVGGYFVNNTYRSTVASICKGAAHTAIRITSGATPLTGSIEAHCLEWYLLDGFARDGYWPWYSGLQSDERHFANGLRLLSNDPEWRCRRLVRYVLYHLEVPQPRRFPREGRIPPLEELEAEIERRKLEVEKEQYERQKVALERRVFTWIGDLLAYHRCNASGLREVVRARSQSQARIALHPHGVVLTEPDCSAAGPARVELEFPFSAWDWDSALKKIGEKTTATRTANN